MDRRQQKTRAAIFAAFTALLAGKSYGKITVQDIIDAANVGRTTFYAHFETKDDLLKAFCERLSSHIISCTLDSARVGGDAPEPVFRHLLQHLRDNENHILELLSCDSGGLFLRYFKKSLSELVRIQFPAAEEGRDGLSRDFLINHISGSFVEMVLWWIKGGRKQTPDELDRCFRAVIEPIFAEDGTKKK